MDCPTHPGPKLDASSMVAGQCTKEQNLTFHIEVKSHTEDQFQM